MYCDTVYTQYEYCKNIYVMKNRALHISPNFSGLIGIFGITVSDADIVVDKKK